MVSLVSSTVSPQRQVASGRRIQSLSDDPLGAASAITEHATLDRLEAYAGANDAATYRLGLADSVLTDVVNQLSAAQTLALSARGSGVTQGQRIVQRDARDSRGGANDINVSFRGRTLRRLEVTANPLDTGGGVFAYQGNANDAGGRVEQPDHRVDVRRQRHSEGLGLDRRADG
jgi:flagellar hook-associated protein 3 FlgL